MNEIYVLFNMKNDCFLHNGGKEFWWATNNVNANNIDTLTEFTADSNFCKILLCTMKEKDINLLNFSLVNELRKFQSICFDNRGNLLMSPIYYDVNTNESCFDYKNALKV